LTRKGLKINLKLVEVGGLLHDIGRSKTHSVLHGSCGGLMAQDLGLPTILIGIIERHVGAGIPVGETAEIGLPNRDFIPETMEEKIVAYADKLIMHNSCVSFKKSFEDFSKKLGQRHPAVKRLEKLHMELSSLLDYEF